MKKNLLKALFVPAVILPLMGAGGSCSSNETPQAVRLEQRSVDQAQLQLERNQPAPVFDWSLERNMLIAIYRARQKATLTYSYVQSPYTGKVLWQCNSIGFPIPYATQITNPDQGIVIRDSRDHDGSGVIPLPEPNGLYSPADAEGTWVPCVNGKGQITPVYEERRVTVFLRPMIDQNGTLSPDPKGKASFTINPQHP